MDYTRPGLANIVTGDRHSYLLQVTGQDPTCVVGYFVDIRGLRVSTDEARFRYVTGKPERRDEIALLIWIGDESPALPGPGQLAFDHQTRDYVGVG